MEIPPALAADLASLTQTLPDPDVDLHQLLSELARGVTLAVPSYLGMSLSVPTGADTDFRATVLAQSARHEDVRASLRWPLTALSGSRAAGILTFYASRPGAFADLVADLGGSRHLDPGALSLDADLTVPDPGRTPPRHDGEHPSGHRCPHRPRLQPHRCRWRAAPAGAVHGHLPARHRHPTPGRRAPRPGIRSR